MCKLCWVEVEDAKHFIAECSVLHQERICLLETTPLTIKVRLPDPTPSSSKLKQIMLGMCWIEDEEEQRYYIEFVQKLYTIRATSCSCYIRSHRDNSPICGGKKEGYSSLYIILVCL